MNESPIKRGNGFKDIAGQRFGRLLVLSYYPSNQAQAQWLCQCDCGKQSVASGGNLRDGRTQSCGCLVREKLVQSVTTHGMTGTAIYGAYKTMLARCYNPKSVGYPLYGARGITVCDRWRHSFENFFADMGQRPKGKTLDRRDNLKGYSKENCRWATSGEQCRNRRSTILVTIGAETLCVFDWCQRLGTNWKTAYRRISRGWEPSRAVTTPVK